MPDNVAIPRHMCVFREVWAELAEYLAREVFAPMRRVVDRDASGIPVHFIARVSQEADALRSWQSRVVAWFHGPMAAAFADPDISDQAMRRVAGRLSCFAEELIDRRQKLRSLAHEPTLRAVACRLDAACFALLKQLKGFVSGVVDALDPEVLRRHRAMGRGDDIDVSFTFRIEMDEPLAEVDAWIERARGMTDCPAPYLAVQDEETAPDASRNAVRTVNVITAFLLIALLISLLAFGSPVILVILLVAIVIFAIRHPLMALIALFILGN